MADEKQSGDIQHQKRTPRDTYTRMLISQQAKSESKEESQLKVKESESKNEIIEISQWEDANRAWYGDLKSNSSWWGRLKEFFGFVDTPPERRILTFLFTKYPDFLAELEPIWKDNDALLGTPTDSKEVKSLPAQEKQGHLYRIFFAIQDHLNRRLKEIPIQLAEELMSGEDERGHKRYHLLQKNPEAEKAKQAKELCEQYIKGEIKKEQLDSNLFNLSAIGYLDHAKRRFAQRKEDAKAALKQLKKDINAFARTRGFSCILMLKPGENPSQDRNTISLAADGDGMQAYWYENDQLKAHPVDRANIHALRDAFRWRWSNKIDKDDERRFHRIGSLCGRTGRLTKGENEQYRYIEDHELEAHKLYEVQKVAKRQEKASKLFLAKIAGFIYPLLRSFAAAFATCALLGTLTGWGLFPVLEYQIAVMVTMAVCIFAATYYSNRELATDGVREYQKKEGILKWIYEVDEQAKNQQAKVKAQIQPLTQPPAPNKETKRKSFGQKIFESAMIIAMTVGTLWIYGPPLFSTLQKLADQLSLGASANLPFTIGAYGLTVMIMGLATLIFMPKISNFVRKEGFSTVKNFIYEKFINPVRSGKTLKEQVKLVGTHVVPNFLRVGVVLGCVALANWASFEGLLGHSDKAFALMGWQDQISNALGVTLLVLNAMASFIYVYKSLHKATESVSARNVGLDWDSRFEDNTQALDHAARFDYYPGQSPPSDSHQIKVAQTSKPHLFFRIGDAVTRAFASLVGQIGMVAGGEESPASMMLKSSSAATVSTFNKIVAKEKIDLDRAGKPLQTYSKLSLDEVKQAQKHRYSAAKLISAARRPLQASLSDSTSSTDSDPPSSQPSPLSPGQTLQPGLESSSS